MSLLTWEASSVEVEDKMSSVEEIHDWLNALGLLPEHDVDAVLGNLLKDGISLCRLVNRLKPGTVTNISTGYLPENALHNVEKFLQACKVLGIKESFNPSDLLEMRDFDRVLNTLQGLFQYSSQIGLGRNFTRHRKSSSASPPPISFTAPLADDVTQAQHVVRALYNFKGTGDDELSFQKGDLIMVIKVVDGGWWEGVIEDRVGWFPGNHVEEVAPEENSFKESKKLAINKRDSVLRYHDLVVQDIIDSERTYVLEMMMLLSAYLTPLKTADVITTDDVFHLTGNLPAVAATHERFFKRLEELVKLPAEDQTIARLFMDVSSEMEQLYTAYCMNHPRAVAILTDNSDKISAYMESKGASIPGMLVLTQNLSKPIRRLEKYPALLVELQRHTQDSHKDKGNVEKAINFYGALLTSTQEARKKKEAEYEMLSNPVKGYAGKCLMELGECSCVVTGSEVISAETIDERFYLVFPGVLVILAVGQSLSGYELQYKFTLDTITMKKAQDEENFVNAIEIIYSGNKCIQTSINSLKDMNLLLQTIAANGKAVDMSKVTLPMTTVSSPPRVTSGSVSHYASHRRLSSNPVQRQRFWGFKSLRPAPPLNSAQILQLREQEREKDTRSSVKSHKAAFINVATPFKRRSKVEEVHVPVTASIERVAPDSVQATSGGDTAVLRVIEAYCLGSRMKQAASAEDGALKMISSSMKMDDNQNSAREAQPRKKPSQSRFSMI
ncbi:rho guanine nucleotide exchange factor 7-like isoform X2 [Dysidea avara]|uniref:rho guanine nucleotide exchange factor 7-like isoform X2 n=1 Tax=Dysidea avara TaxID=196820 RepID=UPI00331E029B